MLISQFDSSNWRLLLACTACMLLLGAGQPMPAQEYRIETDVYNGNSNEPVGQHLTLFSDGLIYDFKMSNEAQPKPVEIVIYNSRDKTFNLLDMNRSLRLPLQQVQLVQMVDGLRQQTRQDKTMKFLVEDTYEEDFDITSGWVALTSDSIEYRFKGAKPSDASILPSYFEFIDNFSRLNASDPKNLPPFARIRLNQSIKKLGLIPSQIDVTLKPNGVFKERMTMRSKHTLNLNLSDKDRQRIKDAKASWMTFKAVNLSKYRNLKKPSRLALIPKKNTDQATQTKSELNGSPGNK